MARGELYVLDGDNVSKSKPITFVLPKSAYDVKYIGEDGQLLLSIELSSSTGICHPKHLE